MSRTNPETGNYLHSLEKVNNDRYSSLWSGKLELVEDKKNKNIEYEYHATGYADLNGRKYVALPKGTNIKDPTIIKKYNLM